MSQQLQKIAEGREAEIFAWQDGAVLRLLRNRNAQLQVEWEAAAMRAAAGAGVRVPAVQGTTTVDGRPGLVMERIDGPDMLTIVGRKPWLVWSIGRTSGRLHAELHEVAAPEDLPSLKERFRSASAAPASCRNRSRNARSRSSTSCPTATGSATATSTPETSSRPTASP